MNFPFEFDEDITSNTDENKPLTEYEIDCKTGKLTGRIINGVEALKAWVYLVLNTNRYAHVIYSWDYGNELSTLIGKSYSLEYIKTVAEQMVEECLLVNEKITGISDFIVDIKDDKLTVKFTLETIYGGIKIDV